MPAGKIHVAIQWDRGRRKNGNGEMASGGSDASKVAESVGEAVARNTTLTHPEHYLLRRGGPCIRTIKTQ